MTNKTKDFFKWLILTNLGRVILSFTWLLSFLTVDRILEYNSENYDTSWAFWVAMIGVTYLIGFIMVAIVYAWVINPINDYKSRKKNK